MASHLLIFNHILLNVITPLNFVIYNHYTFTELLIYPILAALLNSDKILNIHPWHRSPEQLLNKVEFSLSKLPEDNAHLCFINYPCYLKIKNATDY